MQWLLKNLPPLAVCVIALIFSQWTKLLDVMIPASCFLGESYYRLDGSNSVEGRQDMIDSFNAPDARAHVSFFSQQVETDKCGYSDPHDVDFNPTDRQAKTACIDRQKKKVTIYRLVCNGTVDQVIAEKPRKIRNESACVERLSLSSYMIHLRHAG